MTTDNHNPRVNDVLSALNADPQTGLAASEADARLKRDGPNQIPEKKSHPLLRFAKKFWGLSAWMLELIVALSYALGKTTDGWIALSLLVVNAILSFLQEQRASSAVAMLRQQLQVMTRVMRDGTWQSVPAPLLVAGDIIRVRIGDFIPADAQLIAGELQIDQSAITGESRELAKVKEDVLYAGSIVRRGEATAVVTATGVRTFFGRTVHLVESAHPKLHIEDIISRVVKWLFIVVGVMVVMTLIISMAKSMPLVEILPLSLVLLMSAVPIALPVMFTVSMAVGSVELARRGVLVTRLSAAEDAANMDVLCADKTGTLTINRLSLLNAMPEAGFNADDVIHDGALAANEADQDPIDLAFLRAVRERGLQKDPEKIVSFTPFSPATRRTEAIVATDAGEIRVMKGALQSVAAMCGLDAAALAELESRAQTGTQQGLRVLAVARATQDTSWRLLGLAFLSDPPRSDSRQLIAELRAFGVTVKMLTGDALLVAREIGHQLGLDTIIRSPSITSTQSDDHVYDAIHTADGFAEVYPEDKYNVVKTLQAENHVVAMTGDGVNDAPALRQAEVGIAVCNATDAAKGAASVVLTTEGLGGIVELVKTGRMIYQRVLTWIVNKVSRTILKAGFVTIAFLITGKFVISALGMVLLVFMTDFVKIALSTDRVRPSQRPETWNISPLVRLAVMLGVLMLVESLGLLAIGWHWFALANHNGQLQTFVFQTLLFFALFSIISIRERRMFWSSLPSTVLGVAILLDGCIGVVIGTQGLAELKPIPLKETAFIIGYACVFSLFINDMLKSLVIARMQRAD